ncbi:MAG: hypothetical protein E6G92_06935 [Alphaproteobacteria bacterium]|nr:MAG: hypothetical protein E6G92_06935 [Alphaproteobacteria bacterium]
MKQKLHLHRPAMAALSALVASATAPVFAQDVVAAPPPVVVAPPPPVVHAPAPAIVTPALAPAVSAPVARPAPAPETRAARTVTRSTTTRSVTHARAAPPARTRAAPVQSAPAPVPVAAEPAAPAAVAPPPAAPAPVAIPPIQAAAPAAQQGVLARYWPWLAAAGVLLLAALTLIALRRRREAYEEQDVYYEEPVYEAEAEPAYAAPLAAAAVEEVSEPDSADMAALAASSEPVPDRPWLEFLMRPIRAGTSEDEAVVEYELTVGNTGSAPARDVRVSTWMVAAGEGSEMERSLIEPPAGATRSDLSIEPGDGARVEGAMSLPRDGLHGDVLPVVVADARYTLPDGSEGRTHASFAIGRAGEDDGDLEPFKLDRTGITENVEARLHGEPERV